MSGPGLALLLLAGSLLAALAGGALLVASASRRATLAERSALLPDEAGLGQLADRLDRLLRRTRPGRELASRLAGGGVEMTALGFVATMAAAAIGGYVLARVLLSPGVSIVVALGCAMAPLAWLERKREQRREAFIAQLPEVARLLSNGASAGLSLLAAVELASREMDEPAGSELRRLVEEQRLGRSIDEGLEALRRRTPSREVGVLISTLVIQQRAGGDAVQALQGIATTLEARKDLRRELRTIMSGTVFTSYVVGAIGVGVVFFMDLIRPGLVEELLSSPAGIVACVVSGILFTIGFVLIRRTTRIEA